MTDAQDAQGRLLTDTERTTRLGRWLRSIGLNELPQIFNILAEHMSWVGLRPLAVAYLERYTPDQARRHWHNRLGSDQWTQCVELGSAIRARCLVRRSSLFGARLKIL